MTRIKAGAAALALLLGAGPAFAASEMGLEHEQLASFEATVVDLLCEVAGDCPENCGDGKRQLGLLTADGRLIPAVKNTDLFAGAVNDLLPFCGRTVEVDGLLIESPRMPLFMVQQKREPGAAEWLPAKAFIQDWRADHESEGEWFREDPLIQETIAEQGVFGIPGLEPPAE